MYSKKSAGPTMEPWGTPALTGYSCKHLKHLTISVRVARIAYHEKPSVFPGGMPGVTWLKIYFTLKMNQQYRIFFNESKIDRIRHNIQKTGLYLFFRFHSNYILSFVNRKQKQKYLQNSEKKTGGNFFCQFRRW